MDDDRLRQMARALEGKLKLPGPVYDDGAGEFLANIGRSQPFGALAPEMIGPEAQGVMPVMTGEDFMARQAGFGQPMPQVPRRPFR